MAQEIGTSENLPISQKAVKEAIESVNANVKGEGAYLCNEKGEVLASFGKGNFEAVGLEHINKLEDIKNEQAVLPVNFSKRRKMEIGLVQI